VSSTDVAIAWQGTGAPAKIARLSRGVPRFYLFIGSTRTSTIPGISIAGPSPEATLLTPGLDSEYLITGRVISFDVIPMTPDGIPTPAVVSRAVIRAASIPALVIDAGSYLSPKVPHAVLPSKEMGGRVDECAGLSEGAARRLFAEAEELGKSSASPNDTVVVGESIPGGTTTALGILAGLGYRAWGRVSSAGPENPHRLKESVVKSGLRRCGCGGLWEVISCVGDPVHVSIAGFVRGAAEAGAPIVLAGGTQMVAVLAILSAAGAPLNDIVIGTTRWLVEDPSSDIVALVREVAPEVPILYYSYDFGGFPYEGLRKYEEGYVKEGVGLGGLAVVAHLIKGLGKDAVHTAVLREYEGLLGRGG